MLNKTPMLARYNDGFDGDRRDELMISGVRAWAGVLLVTTMGGDKSINFAPDLTFQLIHTTLNLSAQVYSLKLLIHTSIAFH
jgi:hypothetical protein